MTTLAPPDVTAFKTRYVRTPAGVARYKVPIGSPIPIGRRVKARPSADGPPPRRTVRTEAGAARYKVPVGSPIPLGRRVRTRPQPADDQPRAVPRSDLDAWTEDADRIANIPQGDDRDDQLAAIWREQGFDAPPRVVSDDEFDQLPDDHEVMYRGIAGERAEQWADEFRTGDAFPGLGTYGNGSYAATDRDEADGFARGRGWRGAAEDGVVVRMALPPNARTISLSELRELAGKDERLQSGSTGRAFGDPGRLASALGYDAIWMQPDPSSPARYYVVLNRGALIVAASSRPPRQE